MIHMNKCFQAIDKLKLDQATAGPTRPNALGMESCVGTEYVPFSKPMPLAGKVEEYMTVTINTMRSELLLVLGDSVKDYPKKAREKWLFDWTGQIILVVSQMYWCQEVEEAFGKMKAGQMDAMKKYNEFQRKQLTKLIEVTRTELTRPARQKIMNMITIDAHSRDMVEVRASKPGDRRCQSWHSACI